MQRDMPGGNRGLYCDAFGAWSHSYANCQFRGYVCSSASAQDTYGECAPRGDGPARAATAAPAQKSLFYNDVDCEYSEE